MTIKEFAALCKCSTQTLRYYDRIQLLTPARVDQWSGYRYYNADQAIDFIKIKNLQAADFTIKEIKHLLTVSDDAICNAFAEKIQLQEAKLEQIKNIRQTYLNEKTSMEKLIHNLTDFILGQLKDFEGLKEFGLKPEDGPRIAELVRTYMEEWTLRGTPSAQDITLTINDEVIRGADKVAERIASLTPDNLADTVLLGDASQSEEDDFDPANYETIWSTSGWEHVYTFIDDIPSMEDAHDYVFFFQLNQDSYRDDISLPLFMLGAMLLKKGDIQVCMGCSVERSPDNDNHFALMRKR